MRIMTWMTADGQIIGIIRMISRIINMTIRMIITARWKLVIHVGCIWLYILQAGTRLCIDWCYRLVTNNFHQLWWCRVEPHNMDIQRCSFAAETAMWYDVVTNQCCGWSAYCELCVLYYPVLSWPEPVAGIAFLPCSGQVSRDQIYLLYDRCMMGVLCAVTIYIC